MNFFNFLNRRFLSSNFLAKIKKIKKAHPKGFTILELLIVIAIIAILAAIIIVGANGAQASARDAGRLSDLSQTKKSLQAYYLAYNGYPTTGNDGISLEDNATFTQTMKSSGYMSTIPRDPKYTTSTGEYTYKYIATTSNAFTLCARSEAKGNYFCADQTSEGVNQTSSAPVFGVWGGGSEEVGGATTWIKVLGGTSTETAGSIEQTSDGGYIVAGRTSSFGAGSSDFLITKLDSSGTLSWAKAIGGTSSETAGSIEQTSDGGYIVAGETMSFGAGWWDFLVTKLDSSGNLSWAKTIGGASYEYPRYVHQTLDGGYVIAGYTGGLGSEGGGEDFFITKLDSSGNLSWAKTIGGTGNEWALSAQQTSDGGYIMAGRTNSFGAGNYDTLLVKLDSSGNLSWAKTIGGTGNEWSKSVQQTSDGGYILSGFTTSFGVGNNFLITKLDSSGNASWSKTIAGANGGGWASPVIQQTPDGGYIMSDYTNSFGAGGSDFFLTKLDSSGNLSWAKTIGGTNTEYFYSLGQTFDGGYVVAGATMSFGAGGYDFFIGKLDSSGNVSDCSLLSSISPAVSSPSPTVVSQTPSIFSQNPTIASPSLTVSSPSPTITNECPI
ncbi:MAG: prepilin-type N-terminal cleavage/methylation domain-containing protein [Candidatus Paceibacterota bacterium]|jgi:prepilin-type N-terminal cleavage/methylation domain-containing protein